MTAAAPARRPEAPPTETPVIEVVDAFCLLPTDQGAVAALRGLNLVVPAGERLVVHGPNGSGKTTLLRVLIGDQPLAAGSAVVAGRRVGLEQADLAAWRAERLGWIDQQPGRTLRPELDVLDNVALQLRLLGRRASAARQAADEALERLGIGALSARSIADLSGGEAQRVAAAAAIVHRPTVVFADEPAGQLDGESADALYATLAAAVGDVGAALVMVSHDTRATAVADRVVRIRDGRVAEVHWPASPAGAGGTPGVVMSVDGRGWLRLPDAARVSAGIGDTAAVVVEDGRIVVRPIDPPARRSPATGSGPDVADLAWRRTAGEAVAEMPGVYRPGPLPPDLVGESDVGRPTAPVSALPPPSGAPPPLPPPDAGDSAGRRPGDRSSPAGDTQAPPARGALPLASSFDSVVSAGERRRGDSTRVGDTPVPPVGLPSQTDGGRAFGGRSPGAVIATMADVTSVLGGREVLVEFGLEVRRGIVTAIKGPSGSGKSTLLRLLSGLQRPTSGAITVDGVDLATLDRDGLAGLRRRTVAMVLQEIHLAEPATLAVNLELARSLRGRPADGAGDRAMLDRLAVLHLADRSAQSCSGGERQRAALGRALVAGVPLLILDEPSSQLDEAATDLIAGVLAETARAGAAVVVATHDPGLLAVADVVVELG